MISILNLAFNTAGPYIETVTLCPVAHSSYYHSVVSPGARSLYSPGIVIISPYDLNVEL